MSYFVPVGAQSHAALGNRESINMLNDDLVQTSRSTRSIRVGAPLNVRMFTHPYARGLIELLPEFVTETGLDVDLQQFAVDDYLELVGRALIEGSDQIDVMTLTFMRMGLWIEAGWATDLAPFISDRRITDGASLDIEDFAAGCRHAVTRGPSIFGLPFYGGASLMMYRKDILDEQGIAAPPASFEQLLETAQSIHSPETCAYLTAIESWSHDNWHDHPSFHWTYASFLFGYGGQFFKAAPHDLMPELTSPSAIQALETYTKLIRDFGPPNLDKYGPGEVGALFREGRAAIWFDEDAKFQATMYPGRQHPLDRSRPGVSIVSDKIAFAHVPAGPFGRFPQLGTQSLMIPAGSKRKLEAWEFIKWATSKTVMAEVARRCEYLNVPRRSAAKAISSEPRYHFQGTNVALLHNEAIDFAWKGYMAYRMIPPFDRFRDVLNAHIGRALCGRASPSAALAAAQTESIELLKDSGYLSRAF